ncbi:MAG: DEAD/DEAH box helicase [Acidimicrobiia bacterium]
MTTTFAALGVAPAIVEVLAQAGIIAPFPIQAATIPDGRAGRDVCGKAKTGSGKTLAFGIPMLERVHASAPGSPQGCVLVPTRELANQVEQVLAPLARAMGFRTLPVYGGVSIEPQVAALQHGVEVIIATPGRCIDLLERGELSLAQVSVLVLDEADRMVDMGFLPQVQKILYHVKGEHQTMLFSATLDGAINQIVKTYMNDPVAHEVGADETTVEAMEHRFLHVHEMDKVKVAATIARHSQRTLLFVRTKRMADKLVVALKREGVNAGAIHGDLRQGVRERALQSFTEGTLPVLVATDVAARGIHVDDVDVVIHYDPADDHKSYLHRSGRTARAGRTGVAVTLSLWNEENTIRQLQRRLGLRCPIVEVFSNDPRLGDLLQWNPATLG